MASMLRLAAAAGAVLCCALPAAAQETLITRDEAADNSDFDPTRYGMATFEEPTQLYDLLTQQGRCPPKEMAAPRQPCAFVFYVSVNSGGEGYGQTFKPIFQVISEDAIWAMHDGKLKKVRVKNLYYDETTVRGAKRRYVSAAVIGNEENRANCEAMRPCLSDLVAEDMFLMYGKIPDSVVDKLWGQRMVDPGTVRVR